MQVNLYTGNESRVFTGVAEDAQGRETDVVIRADNLQQAKDRVSDSMADYRWTDARDISQKSSHAA